MLRTDFLCINYTIHHLETPAITAFEPCSAAPNYEFPSDAVKVYDLDGDGNTAIMMDYQVNDGSGKRDYRVLIPDNRFNDSYSHVVLFTEHGLTKIVRHDSGSTPVEDGDSNDGYEEWCFRPRRLAVLSLVA